MLVLDVIQQANDVLAPDIADLATATEYRIDQALEDAAALVDTAQAPLLAGEIFLGDRAQRVGPGPLGPLGLLPVCGLGIAALANLVQGIGGELAARRQRDATRERELVRPAVARAAIADGEALGAARLNDDVEPACPWIGDLPPLRPWLEVTDCDIGESLCRHVRCPQG